MNTPAGPAPGPTPPPGPTPTKESAIYLDPRELVGDPKSFVGRNIWVQGKALNVNQQEAYTWIQLTAGVRDRPGSSENLVVEIFPKAPTILKDECYRLYGVVAGTQPVTRTLTGAKNEAAYIRGYAWEPAPRTSFSCELP